MRKLLLLLALTSPFYARANGVNNGGDELRILFEKARTSAAIRISALKYCSFAPNVSAEVKQWIVEHKAELVNDVSSSQHVWNTDPQSTCAFTQTTAAAPISLSFVTCRSSLISEDVAGEVLTHESVHHFGISDEIMADVVARAVYSANIGATCLDFAEDPFDPRSCSGSPINTSDAARLLPAGASKAQIGTFRAYSRRRACNTLNGCSDWSRLAEPSAMINWNNGGPTSDQKITPSGIVSLYYTNTGRPAEVLYLGFDAEYVTGNIGYGFGCPIIGGIGGCGWYYPQAIRARIDQLNVTNHCAKFSITQREGGSTVSHWGERETVFLSYY